MAPATEADVKLTTAVRASDEAAVEVCELGDPEAARLVADGRAKLEEARRRIARRRAGRPGVRLTSPTG